MKLRSPFVLVLAALASANAYSHPISMTTGQAVVHTNAVEVAIEVMVEDFMLFYGLVPDEKNMLSRETIASAIERHKAFLLRDFAIRDESGEPLKGVVSGVETKDVPEEGLEAGTLMEHSITYRLRYPLPEAPTVLTFQQVFGMQDIPLPAMMDLEVRQANLTIGDSVDLVNDGKAETFEFDWSDQERAGETPEEAWRRRREERKKERMGITSYDAIYGFVYINDREVRIEILIPVATLETWVEVKRKSPDALEVDEQEAARVSLAPFFRDKNKVVIDGIEVQPTLQWLDFYGVRFKDFAMRPEPQRLSAATARVGVILSYGAKGPPSQVDITWEYFNAAVHKARTVLYTYQDTRTQAFTAYQPTLEWKSPGKRELPQITALDAGSAAQAPSDEEASRLAGTLLRNTYRALDYRDESDVYDALARSVEGNLLADLYLEIQRSLVMQEQGGAIAEVKDVTVTDSTVAEEYTGDAGFGIHLTWTVEGTVEHWGHIHTRINQYEADFTVRPVEKAWKITAMQVTGQKRLRYQVSVRRF